MHDTHRPIRTDPDERPETPAEGTGQPGQSALRSQLRTQARKCLKIASLAATYLVHEAEELYQQEGDKEVQFVQDLRDLERGVAKELARTVEDVLKLATGKREDVPPETVSRKRHDMKDVLHDVTLRCGILRRQADELLKEPHGLDVDAILASCDQCVDAVEALLRYSKLVADETTHPTERLPTPLTGGESSSILIVDDEKTTRELLARLLSQEGYVPFVAEDGEHALEILRSESVDLVLLDLVMPGISGIGVLKQIKDDPKLRHVPVLMISGYDERQGAIQCFELGAEDYLSKPVDQALLHVRIRACLEKKRLFEQFFPPEIARQLPYRPELLDRQELTVTILFCDIRGYSRISEHLGHVRTVEWIIDVMDRLSACVARHQGVLADFMGDQLMALWGAPDPRDNADQLACDAALDMMKQLPELNQKWQGRLREPMDVGIGIHTGIAHVGNIGSSRRFKYGTLGSTVNLASRVQGATKHLRSGILITQATRTKLPAEYCLRRLGKIKVVNIEELVDVYELSAPGRPNWSDLKRDYEQALVKFERRDFLGAIRLLGNLLDEHANDGPSDLLLSRAVHLKQNPHAGYQVLLDLESK